MRLEWPRAACYRGKGGSKPRQGGAGCARTRVAPEPEMRVRSGSMDKLVEVDASPAASGGLSVAGSRGTAAPSSACSLMALPGAPLRGWAQATRGSSGSRSSSSSSEGRGGWQSSAMASAGGSGAQSGRAPPGWGLSIAPNRGRRTAPTPPHQSTGPRPPRPAAGHAPPLEPRDACTRLRRRAGGGASQGGAGRGGAGLAGPPVSPPPPRLPGRCCVQLLWLLLRKQDQRRFHRGASPPT